MNTEKAPRRTFSPKEKLELVRLFRKSNLTKSAFAKEHDIERKVFERSINTYDEIVAREEELEKALEKAKERQKSDTEKYTTITVKEYVTLTSVYSKYQLLVKTLSLYLQNEADS